MNLRKAKILGTILGVVLFVLAIAGITYAWYTWESGKIKISGTSECFTINYTKGQIINNESVILFDESKIITNNQITIKSGMAITDVTASIDSDCSIAGNLAITLDISVLNEAYISGNSIGAFKYVVASYDPSIYTDITVAALSGSSFNIIESGSITSTQPITLVNQELSTSETGYLVIFYVDGDLANNDAGESTFSGTIKGVATQIVE